MPKLIPKPARIAEKRRMRNKSVRSSTKTCITKAKKLIDAEEMDAAREATTEAVSALDKAVKKGVICRNNASRHKSRLMKKLNEATKS